MAQMAGQLRHVNTDRSRALLVPREHGAWGILLVPLVTGACIALQHGGGVQNLLLFTTAAVALFWMRTPLESWMGTSAIKAQTAAEKKSVMRATLGIGIIAAAALWMLLGYGENLGLIAIGVAACGAFGLQAAVKFLGRSGRMPAQMIGAIGLTSTGAGAYYVVSGALDWTAFGIWLANWLFACDQIHFVQMRLRNSKVSGVASRLARGWTFFAAQFAMLATVAVASRLEVLPYLAILAFVPVVLRGCAWFAQSTKTLELHWIGITELLHSITFGVLLMSSYYLR